MNLPRQSPLRRRASQRGSALILVYWLIFMLSMIVATMFRIVKHDLDLTISQKLAFRARQVAEMGINWAMNPAVKEYDTAILNQQISEDESFSVKIRGEGGRLNINFLLQQKEASRTFCTKLFTFWGLGNEEADTLFDILVDWTDADDTVTGHGMEKEDYARGRRDNMTSYPFNRPFYHIDEVTKIPGFANITARVEKWRDYFTIYSAGRIDLNEAEAEVMAAVAMALDPTSDPERDFPDKLDDAQQVVEYRWGPDLVEDTDDDRKWEDLTEPLTILGVAPDDPFAAAIFTLNDPTVHIECLATVGEFRKRVVLVVRNRTGTPQILTREEHTEK